MRWRSISVLLLGLVNLLAFGGVVGARGKAEAAGEAPAARDPFKARRLSMVEAQIESRGIRDPRVLEAMRSVERHRFVPLFGCRYVLP